MRSGPPVVVLLMKQRLVLQEEKLDEISGTARHCEMKLIAALGVGSPQQVQLWIVAPQGRSKHLDDALFVASHSGHMSRQPTLDIRCFEGQAERGPI